MKLKASSMKSVNGHKTKDKVGKTRIVVLGTGFAGSAFMESFNRKMPAKNRDDSELIAVNHTNYLTFSPLLYEVATGQVYEHHISIPVCCDITDHGFRFLEEEITEVNPERNEVVTRHGSIKYDHLVMALGTENNDFGIEGVAEHAIPLKTIKDGAYSRFFTRIESSGENSRIKVTSFDRERNFSEKQFNPVGIYSGKDYKVVMTYIKVGQFIPVHSPGTDLVFAVFRGTGTGIFGDREERLLPGSVVVIPGGEKRGIKAITDMEGLHVVSPIPDESDHVEVFEKLTGGRFL